MLNKLSCFCRENDLLHPGDKVICAVSGGADSMALLWGMYLLREKLGITLECAHFNHHLRGEESDRDADFVRQFCSDYGIPFHYGESQVVAGEKGLEAAAREARYGFLRSLDGTVATAHTADDNAETVLMHLLRGTGLNGLGGIAPKNGNIIRPLLTVTRAEIMDFIREYSLSFVEDSTNSEDDFLRNRLRHKVMPLMKEENPQFALSASKMALRLRQDEDYIRAAVGETEDIPVLRALHPAVRAREIAAFLEKNGLKEPGARQIEAVENLIFSEKPSASVRFQNGVMIGRCYDKLQVVEETVQPLEQILSCPGSVIFGEYRITARQAEKAVNTKYRFTVSPVGDIRVRCRRAGDEISFAYGTKSLKKLFIDEKIPANQRSFIPVISDDSGLLGVCGYGADMGRGADGSLVEIEIEHI